MFLAAATLLWAVVCAAAPEAGARATAILCNIAARIVPVLVLVFGMLFVLNLWLTPERVRRWLGSSSGGRGWAASAAAGVLSMGPVYAWYPLLADLRRQGMRPALAAVFLYARAVKLQLLPLAVVCLGLEYAVMLNLAIAVAAFASGWLTERLAGGRYVPPSAG